jgi:hypothetical protein
MDGEATGEHKKKLQNEELRNMYSSPDIIVINSTRMRRGGNAGLVANIRAVL